MDATSISNFTKATREHIFCINSSRKGYSNTATKDNWSDLVEFILRGEINCLAVDVADHKFIVRVVKMRSNGNYKYTSTSSNSMSLQLVLYVFKVVETCGYLMQKVIDKRIHIRIMVILIVGIS